MNGYFKYCLCCIRIKIFLRLLSRIIYDEYMDRLDLSQKSVIFLKKEKMMEKILQIISNAPLFNGLSEEQLNDVRQIAVDKFYNKGKTIFLEGDDCNGFYIVADGKVKIYKVSFEGKEQILHIYGPGNPFGEVAVFAERADISEEIARLLSHIKQFQDSCDMQVQAGRKLDFIAQEMLREANTIASKSADVEIAHHVVDIKCSIDRLKEQVQNIE